MKLELGTGKILEFLSDERIAHALSLLPGGDNSFAILDSDDGKFMQTDGSPLDGFVLEYNDGSLESHFRCDDENLELSSVQRAIQLYFNRDDRWRTEFAWSKLDLSDLRKPRWRFWR